MGLPRPHRLLVSIQKRGRLDWSLAAANCPGKLTLDPILATVMRDRFPEAYLETSRTHSSRRVLEVPYEDGNHLIFQSGI
jgi:hypothetical protein